MSDAPTRYFRVAVKFWTDEKSSLWNDDIRLLALYLLTCPHRTTEGIFRLPKSYVLGDLRWSQRRLSPAWKFLLSAGFLQYDEKAKIVLLTHALRYQAPENPNQMKAARKSFETLPETVLRSEFLRLAKQLAPAFYELLTKPLGEPLPQRLPKRLGDSLNSPSLNSPETTKTSSSASPAREAAAEDLTPIQRLTERYRAVTSSEDPKDFGRVGQLINQHGEHAVEYAIQRLRTAMLDETIQRPFAWLAKVSANAPPPDEIPRGSDDGDETDLDEALREYERDVAEAERRQRLREAKERADAEAAASAAGSADAVGTGAAVGAGD